MRVRRSEQDPGKPFKSAGRRTANAIRRVVPHAPEFIYDLRPGKDQHRRWRGLLKCFQAAAQERTVTFVIVRRPLEEFALRQLKDPIVIPAGSDVALVSVITDATILGGKLAANCFRSVRGGIIRKDQFEVVIILKEEDLKRAGEVLLSVENREANTDFGTPRLHSMLLHPQFASF